MAKRRVKRRDTAEVRRIYLRSRRAEAQFARKLRQLARRIGELAHGMYDADDPIGSSQRLQSLLRNYGQTLRPWAREQARRMVVDVMRRDEVFWAERTKQMGRALKEEIQNAPTGVMFRERTQEAASYITSLPLEAAQRIEQLTVKMITNSARAGELSQDILRTGHVTKSRADLIARTEVARTASTLTEVRARHVGSTHYTWRTVGDIDVRDLHRHLNGNVFAWDDPPVTGSNGERSAPGGIYNCRCYAEPHIPDEP